MAQTDSPVATETLATAPQLADPWAELLPVPAVVSVEAPVAGLTVRELYRLQVGSIIATTHLVVSNVPVSVGGRLVAWGEFQVTGENLAVRLAELA